ncbi:MAG: hypothetical protein ACR2H3_12580 [Acidimicrobiales bacterium]
MHDYATALIDAADRALGPWVVDAVRRRAGPAGRWNPAVEAAADEAAEAARSAVINPLRALLEQDFDDQRSTPLAVLRDAVRFPTAVLAAAEVAPAMRDQDQQRRFPEDRFDLCPATFGDFGPEVGEAGIAWGAAKAFAHRQRHGGSR